MLSARYGPDRTTPLVTVVLALVLVAGWAGVLEHSHIAASPNTTSAGSPIVPTSTPAARLPAAGVGSVLAVDDLISNRVISGNFPPPIQYAPVAGIFDAGNGNLYVRGSTGTAISVIDGSTDRAIATLPVGADTNQVAPSIAADPTNGEVYVLDYNADNMTVINGTTEAPVGSIGLLGLPTGIVVDPTTGDLFISERADALVSIVSASAGHMIGNVSVGSDPEGLVYDPTDQRLFVANSGSGNVTVIDVATQKVVANIPTGGTPVGMVWDPTDDYVDVANTASSNVSILSGASDTLVKTISLGTGEAYGLAYSSADDRLFAANIFSNNLTVVDQATSKTVANLSIPGSPQWAAYDPANEQVYVACPTDDVLSIVNASTDSFVKNLTISDLPSAVIVDTSNGRPFVIDSGTSSVDGNATVLSPSTDLSLGSIPLEANLEGVTFDPALHSLEVPDAYGNFTYAVNDSTGLVDRTARVGDLPMTSAYDPTNGYLYVLNIASYNVSIINSTGATVGHLPTGISPTAIAFDSSNGLLYVSSDEGNVTVIDPAHPASPASIMIHAYDELEAVAYDPATNDVYVGDWYGSNVTVIDPTTGTTGASIRVGTDPLAFLVDPANTTLFVANSGSGNISVINVSSDTVVATLSSYDPVALTYDGATNAVYSVGHIGAVVWAYDASTYASLGPALDIGNAYCEGIAYDPVTHYIYVSDEFAGALFVIGPASGPGSYPVTFEETGLPAETSWSVKLGSTTTSSSSTDIAFSEPNATYPFTVGVVPGYHTTGGSGTGNVTVAGLAVDETVTFEYNFSATLATNATSIHLGGSVTLTTSIVGGMGPFAYDYTVLPAGCAGSNASSVTCAPSSVGTHPVTVRVTDSLHRVTVANASFTVQSNSSSSPSSSSSFPTWAWVLLIVLVIIAAFAILALVARRRKKEPDPNPPPASPGTGPPGPTGGTPAPKGPPP
jgi:YVTN family beta-propeller protein